MICTQCKHRNGIGNKFCRECGTPLPLPDSPLALEEASRAERERLTERVSGLLAAAYTLAEQKRYDQALPLAEEAVLLLPDSTAALSLLTTLYEYSGQDEKAIRAMERVVALNPESPGDRQKLGQLRQAFAQAQSDEPFPLRGAAATAGRAATNPSRPAHSGLVGLPTMRRAYLPYLLGGAAAACVVGAGLAANNVRHGHQDAPGTNVARGNMGTLGNMGGTGTTSADLVARVFPGTGGANSASAQNTVQTPATVPATIPTYQVGADPFVNHSGSNSNNGGGGYATYNAPRVSSGNRYRNYGNSGGYSGNGSNGVSLPSFRQMNQGGDNGDSTPTQPIAPIIAVAPGAGGNGGNGVAQSSYGPTESNAAPVRIAAGPPATATGGGSTGSDKGYISITVGPPGSHASGAGSGSTSGGSPSESASGSRGAGGSGNGGSALSRARNSQATGHYGDAVSAYREAINSDASGSAWQGLAQSQESLHDRTAAREAYRNALHAYESQLSAGRNPGAAQRGIDTSKAALEALGE